MPFKLYERAATTELWSKKRPKCSVLRHSIDTESKKSHRKKSGSRSKDKMIKPYIRVISANNSRSSSPKRFRSSSANSCRESSKARKFKQILSKNYHVDEAREKQHKSICEEIADPLNDSSIMQAYNSSQMYVSGTFNDDQTTNQKQRPVLNLKKKKKRVFKNVRGRADSKSPKRPEAADVYESQLIAAEKAAI